MEVKNCRECGRLFNYVSGTRLCPACKDKLEQKFFEVRDYIYANKNATVSQISEDNEVSVQQIKQWIREERLFFSDDSLVGIECENCGTTIKTGRFCEKCKKKMANNIESVYKKEQPADMRKEQRDRAKMRFLDN